MRRKFPETDMAKRSLMRKGRDGVGLVLTGGGARGAYQLGAWGALRDHGVSFKAVSGTSIGALNGALICQGDYHKALGFWDEISRDGVLKIDFARLASLGGQVAADIALLFLPLPVFKGARLARVAALATKFFAPGGAGAKLLKDGVFGLERLMPVLEKYLSIDEVRKSPIPLHVTAFKAPSFSTLTGKAVSYKLQDLDRAGAERALLASVALPLIFPSVNMGGSTLFDGGLTWWAPVELVRDEACERIIVLATKHDFTMEDECAPQCDVLTVKPAERLGNMPLISFLNFDPENVWEWASRGYEDACRAMEAARTGRRGWGTLFL
jgi:NTE family protein